MRLRISKCAVGAEGQIKRVSDVQLTMEGAHKYDSSSRKARLCTSNGTDKSEGERFPSSGFKICCVRDGFFSIW